MSDGLLDFPGDGVHYDMPEGTYHRIKALSKSTAEAALQSPAHWWATMRRARPQKELESRIIGTALHVAVLEPERFDSLYVAAPKINKNSNKWKDWVAANSDRTLLDAEQIQHIFGMARSINRDPVAARLMTDAKTEVSIFWHDDATGVPCKARIDIVSPLPALADPKTCDDASDSGWRTQAAKMRYHCQEAHYRNGWWKLFGEDPAFFFMPVELKPPYGMRLVEHGHDTLMAGREWMARAAEAFLDVLGDGDNPKCYPSGVVQIDLPAWASR